MMHTVATFLLLVVVAEAKYQPAHHDSLTGRGQPLPNLHIKGHVRDNFLIKPQPQHHDALTGDGQALPNPFIKGHVRDNFLIRPQEQHHDALTGQGPVFLDPFIKGHVAAPPPVDNYGSLKNPMVADNAILAMDEEATFCKVSGDQCSQYTLKGQWMQLATTLGGFKPGTCWENGYVVNEGSKDISMPLIGKTNVRFFTASRNEIPQAEVFSQTSPDVISVLAVALISLVGASVTIFTVFHVRHGFFMAGKEPLLTTSMH